MLVVAHVSDLHLGAHLPGAVDDLVADVVAAAPALTVVTGDHTMRARTGQFRAVRTLLDRLPHPLLAVLGNHDVPLGPARAFTPYTRYRRWVEADLDPVVRIPGLTALGLQSMPRWRWKNGRVSRRQASLLVGTLGAAPTGDVRLLALHHPPFARGTAQLVGRGRLGRGVAEAGADLVLAGHTHVPDVREKTLVAPDGTRRRAVVVIAGTATSRRHRGVGLSWSRIMVDDDEIVVDERYCGDSGWRTGRTVSCRRADHTSR
ncbi:metallophosphoesterase family protein [Cryptosporangium minutisporangium]|uniref:Metallophosphoesterase family protein n=1 Tax=Cryptosporangium minutisporangium TaxID=113569 RepID=A0ABP6T0C4_9ACTN